MGIKNHGVLTGQRDTDYLAGTLPYKENTNGDWTPHLPPGEWQRFPTLETMACVSFSALNIIETLYHFYTGEHKNFSDRFTARMSGTTPDGNYLWKVADSIRKDGIVEEEEWPTPANPTWESYYATPPIELINKAKGFLNLWDIKYEWISGIRGIDRDTLIHHLKQSPIQVVIPGHAVMNFYTNNDLYKYFDHYQPFIKQRTGDFTHALKYVMTPLMVTEEILELLYLAIFKRKPDANAKGYIGKPIVEVLKVLIASEENQQYTSVFQAVKSLETWARS